LLVALLITVAARGPQRSAAYPRTYGIPRKGSIVGMG